MMQEKNGAKNRFIHGEDLLMNLLLEEKALKILLKELFLTSRT
jgi:hypothetical protein